MVVAGIEEGRGIVDPAAAVPPPGPEGAALHAVDSEQQIERAADDRRQPGQPDPGDGGRDVPLAPKHVHGDRPGQPNMYQRPDERAYGFEAGEEFHEATWLY